MYTADKKISAHPLSEREALAVHRALHPFEIVLLSSDDASLHVQCGHLPRFWYFFAKAYSKLTGNPSNNKVNSHAATK